MYSACLLLGAWENLRDCQRLTGDEPGPPGARLPGQRGTGHDPSECRYMPDQATPSGDSRSLMAR
jgi:hypothetical protein